MICTFCGTENLPMNRFCGMCGVRLERRKADRRIHETGSAKCAACNHINEPGYKFCGLCGERIDRRVQERRGAVGKSRAANAELPAPQRSLAQRVAAAPAPPPTRTTVLEPEPAYSAPARHEERRAVSSSVTGPSFLGLNDSEGEGEYLLEDERSSGRGLRTLILMVILVAIVGLIYVQWRANLKAKPLEQPKPEPATVPAGGNHSLKIPNTPAAVAGAHEVQAAAAALVKNAASLAKTEKTSEDTISDNHDKLAHKTVPVKATKVAESKSPAKASPAVPVKTEPSVALVKAQKYLQGRGVRQSCEQGLMYLKAATQENDPKAAIQMGALYSSGFCVTQDRVQAYHWFSSARDMEPNNRWIDRNLSQLWAQMTPSERRRIR